MEKTFKILNDSTSAGELESALKSGSDLVIVSSPSEYFEGYAAQNAIGLMKKYPERKIFVTSRVSTSILEKVLAKAECGSGAFGHLRLRRGSFPRAARLTRF